MMAPPGNPMHGRDFFGPACPRSSPKGTFPDEEEIRDDNRAMGSRPVRWSACGMP